MEIELRKIINWAKQDDIYAICNLLQINCYPKQMKNFKPVFWRNQSADSLSNIPFLSNKDISDLNISGSVLDSLYISEKKKKEEEEEEYNDNTLLYMTPHLIFTHYNKGESNVNFFQDGYISLEEISSVMIYTNCTLRTHDNRSLEIYEAKGDNRMTTLGLLTERRRGEKKTNDDDDVIKCAYTQLLDSIQIFFKHYFYIPYFIHPYRLIYFENDKVLKLVSGNLLHYIFVPHCSYRKIKDPLFTHPLSFLNPSSIRIKNDEDIKIKLCEDMATLTLDFFHSSFVTALWLVTHDNKITRNKIILNRNLCLINSKVTKMKKQQQSSKLFWDNNNTTTTTRKKDKNFFDIFWKPTTTTNTTTDDNSSSSSSFLCNNVNGFCACFSECSSHTQQLIHRYGCQHILSVLPNILRKSFENETHENVINTIYNEIELLKTFISKLFAHQQ